ncbi:hypothetical protein N7516_002027, partial [Penicillium verrucosum]|uniref:uncharacterized protein n=1 Tax=Penicillium verrucosum TaxID=60171 RepID=UPI0025452BB5
DTAWAQGYAESAIDAVPQLADKVDTGTVQGNPHATLKTDDPFYASIILQKGPIRVTSAHVYPDGTVVFSKSAYGEVKLAREILVLLEAACSDNLAY